MAYNVLLGPICGFFSSFHDSECPASGGPPYKGLSSAKRPGTCKRKKERRINIIGHRVIDKEALTRQIFIRVLFVNKMEVSKQ